MGVKVEEVWSELDSRFVQDPQGNLKKVINAQAVIASIDNILRTRLGERVMLPQFGSNFYGMVFESMNNTLKKFVSREIKSSIEKWDNRVDITEVKYIEDADNSTISINISFVIKGYNDIFQYKTSFRGE